MTTPPSVRALTAAESSLGLRTGEVRVVEHDPDWADLYAALEPDLAHALADAGEIAHIGSTSISGLAAKPVLDVAIGLPAPIDSAAVVTKLEAIGFNYVQDLGMYGGLFFTATAQPDVVAAHVHVVDVDGFQWRWYLAFRAGLRSDSDLRSTYQRLKGAGASRYPTDRDAYTKAKFDWVLATVTALDET